MGQRIEKLSSNIAAALEKEVEAKKEEAEKHETQRDIEMLSLRKCAEAAMKRDIDEYRKHYKQLENAETLTDQDWTEQFALIEDDEEMMMWLTEISKRGPGMHHKIISNEMM